MCTDTLFSKWNNSIPNMYFISVGAEEGNIQDLVKDEVESFFSIKYIFPSLIWDNR